jgi:hypothetical protein
LFARLSQETAVSRQATTAAAPQEGARRRKRRKQGKNHVFCFTILLASALKSNLFPAEDHQPKSGFRLTCAASRRQRPLGSRSDFHAEICNACYYSTGMERQ